MVMSLLFLESAKKELPTLSGRLLGGPLVREKLRAVQERSTKRKGGIEQGLHAQGI